ncbi:MAG: MFS transporter [Paludibacterium sp.]|uniref:MFS transporter n=1 Tax=Paludibacterium sp. TaxID=1917523 RepID=UPI0025D12E89|nr:MFS transporter [Paludibacterium sp.]MBV8047508.1 MFS transporter [Paludibacterium sp.]MBV8648691.1 MFS transporter [Paludibacterium sp.]
MIEFLQNGMLNFAASYVMGGIGAGPEEFSYAAMAYASCAVLALSQQRRLTLALGPRRLLRLSMLSFAAGAVLCAQSHGPADFILGRAWQGFGAAAFFTGARVEVNRIAGPQRTLALVGFGQALLLGSAMGPLLGGWLLSVADWHWLCWGILPWTLMGWVAAGRFAERDETAYQAGHATPRALWWFAVAVLLLQFLIQQTPYNYFGRPDILLGLLAGLTLAVIVWLRRARPAGVGDMWRQLARRRYLLGLVYYFVCYTMVAANSYIMPLLVQQGLGFTVPTTGVLLSISFLAGLVCASIYALLLARGHVSTLKPVMVLGMMFLAGYGLLMSGLNGEATMGRIAAILLCNGAFMTVFIMAVAQGTFGAVEPGAFSHAYQTKNIIRQLALSSAVSVSTVFIQGRNALHYNRLIERFDAGGPWLADAVRQLRTALPAIDPQSAVGLLGAELSRQTLMLSCLEFYRLEMWVGLGMALILLMQKSFR